MTEELEIENKAAEAAPDCPLDASIHLKQRLSLLPGMGMNDVVHLTNDEVISLPCLPFTGRGGGILGMNGTLTNDKKTEASSQSLKGQEHLIKLIQKLSPLLGMGMNDVVHLSGDEVISLPCLPFMGGDEGLEQHNRKALLVLG